MVEEGRGEALDLVPEGGVLLAVLRLHLAQLLQLVREHEGGENGVGAGQGDEGGRGEGLVGVQSGEGEAEAVLAAGQHARRAAALDVVGLRQAGAAVDQDLEDLVVVLVSGEGERGDVGGVGGRDGVDRLPGVRGAGDPDPLLVTQQQLHALGREGGVEGVVQHIHLLCIRFIKNLVSVVITAVQLVLYRFSQFGSQPELYFQLQLSLWSDPIAFGVSNCKQ